MSTDANKELVRKWVDEVLNKRDVSEQSPAYQLVAADFLGHFPGQPPIEGLEAYRQFGSLYFSAFPDLQIIPEDLTAEGDKVTMRYGWRGTHKGEKEFFGGTPNPGRDAALPAPTLSQTFDRKVRDD